MKLPGFLKSHKHKSEDVSGSEEALEYPGNAAHEFIRPSESPVPADFVPHAGDITPSEAGQESASIETVSKTPTPKAPAPPVSSEPPVQPSAPPAPSVSTPSAEPDVKVQREPDDIESVWFSLIDNPNNEKNLKLLVRYCETRKGPAAVEAALSELAMEPNAYIPQLMLASRALERKAPSDAIRHYEELLTKAAPNDYSLLRMSAELGRHGLPGEVIRLVLPRYDAAKHNAYIGLNILQASKDSGRLAEGQAVWAELQKHDRPGIAAALEKLSPVFGKETPKVKINPADLDSSAPGDMPAHSNTPDTDSEDTGVPARDEVDPAPGVAELSAVSMPVSVHNGDRPRIIDIPPWRLWIPALRDILPEPETNVRVGLYLYSDTSSKPTVEAVNAVKAVTIGLPLLLGEMLLFSAPVVPVVLFPLSFSKGPDSGAAEPDIAELFALCAKESLNFLIAGTSADEGDHRTIRTWILDRAKNTARVLSCTCAPEEFGEAALAHVDEIIGPFSDKNYAFEAKRRGFTYSVPTAPLFERQLDALMRLGLRALVDSGYCSSDILCSQPEFLEKLAELCRMKPFSQNYLMMLLGGMISDRENGGESFLKHRELLFDTAHKLQYTPCVTTARKALDKVLTL